MRLNTLRIIVAMVVGMLLASDAGTGQRSAKVATVGVLLLNPANHLRCLPTRPAGARLHRGADAHLGGPPC